MSDTPSSQERASSPAQPFPLLGADAIATLALLAILPVASAPGFTHLLVLREGLIVLGGLAVLGLWLILLTQQREDAIAIRGRGFLALSVIGIAVCAASALWAADPMRALTNAALALALIGPVLSLLAPTRRRISLRAITRALGGGLLVAAGLTLAAQAGMIFDAVPKPYPDSHILLRYDNALTAAIALPIFLATAFRYEGIDRILGLAASVAAVVLVGAVHDTVLYVALAAGLFVAQLLLIISRRTGSIFARSTLALIISGVLVLAADAVVEDPVRPPMANVFQTPEVRFSSAQGLPGPDARITRNITHQIPEIPSGWGPRSYLNASGWKAFAQKPLQGWGAGHFQVALDTYGDAQHPYFKARYAPTPNFEHAHNALLQIAAELGLLGLVPALLGLVLLMVRGFQTLQKAPEEREIENNIWGVTAASTTAIALACTFAIPWLPSAGLIAVLAFAGWIAVAHTVLGDTGKGALAAWQPDLSDRSLVERLLKVALVPFALAVAAGFFYVPILLGDYQRQWANLYIMSNEPEIRSRAPEQIDRALAHNANDFDALLLAVEIQTSAANFEKAAAYAQRAYALRPDNASLLQLYARLERLRRNFADARALYERAIFLQPAFLDAHVGFATLLAGAGEYDAATQSLLNTLNQTGPPPHLAVHIHVQLARLYLQNKQFKEAEHNLDVAQGLAKYHKLDLHLSSMRVQLEQAIIRESQPGHAPHGGHGGHGGHGHGADPPHRPGHPKHQNAPKDRDDKHDEHDKHDNDDDDDHQEKPKQQSPEPSHP